MKQFNNFVAQLSPLLLAFFTFIALSILLSGFINVLNLFPIHVKIVPHISVTDILVGLTIYLKTSVDFAIFIGNMMARYSGTKNRIAIEIGTACGNALGTFFVLAIWAFFKEVPLLLIVMIILAALVLFSMAEEGLTEFLISNLQFPTKTPFSQLFHLLHAFNSIFKPVISHILPDASKEVNIKKTFLSVLFFACTIPLILGLDDFAGYIPLFTVVHVFGFAVGVFLGHMLLNMALFAAPAKTIQLVRQPLISLFGSLAFLGIGLWGLYEALPMIFSLFR